ncbi:leupaxin-like isoform X2 [Limulus polyphemus]|nr:leupaxin-like isoform X2 [Limulus polyphemus]
MPLSPPSQTSTHTVTTQRYDFRPGSQTVTHTVTTKRNDFEPGSQITTQRYDHDPVSQANMHNITTQRYDPDPGSQATTRTVITQRHDYQYDGGKLSPIYQNQQVHPSQLSSNTDHLSELDSLLEDLNSARLSSSSPEYKVSHVNGVSSPSPTLKDATSPRYGSIRPITKPPQEDRPSMESLLDDLQSVVSPTSKYPTSSGAIPPVKREYITTITYTKQEPSRSPPPASTPVASSATEELDELMASLSDFKVNDNNPSGLTSNEPAYAKPDKTSKQFQPHPQPKMQSVLSHNDYLDPKQQPQPKPQPAPSCNDQLDSMLGSLQTDMSKQGVKTTAKGQCCACKKQIIGQVITALGQTWHPEHFTCVHCNKELGTKNFFEREGEPYCEEDYHKIFAPRCAYCNGPILNKCVTALDRTWHQEHFFCAQCGRQFGEDGFLEKDGKPYCRDDYYDMFAPKCSGCNRPIKENYISALNGQWHPECFVCRDCGQSFNGGSFFDHEGLPYCETHYHAKRGSLCAGCHKPITGRCITAMFRKFHPEHFVCSFCLKQLNKGTFKEQNDKPYCHVCFQKLFG